MTLIIDIEKDGDKFVAEIKRVNIDPKGYHWENVQHKNLKGLMTLLNTSILSACEDETSLD